MSGHKPCYGKMFPDVLSAHDSGVHSGKAFSYEFEEIGLAHGNRSVNVDIQEWDDCTRCDEFDHCYKLSLGMLTLQNAVRGI